MDDKIIFPKFWTESLVRRWQQTQFDSLVTETTALEQLADGRWALPVAPLRTLYSTDYAIFQQLIQLFRLFGIEVHVTQGQGLFGRINWQSDVRVIVDSAQVRDWRGLANTIAHSPLLRTIPHLPALVSDRQLVGLVIDQLRSFNQLVVPEQVDAMLHAYGVNTKTVNVLQSGITLIGADDSTKSVQLHSISASSKTQTIQKVFGDKNTWLINRFLEFGMKTLADITPERLQQVYQSKGIGAGKINKIQRYLVAADPSLKGTAEPTTVSTKERVNSVLTLENLGVSTIGNITPKVLQAMQTQGDGRRLVTYTIMHYHEMATCIPDWPVYAKILPMAGQLYQELTGKPAPERLSLRLYALLIACVWALPKRKAKSFEMIVAYASKLEAVSSWDMVSDPRMNQSHVMTVLERAGIKLTSILEPTILMHSLFAYEQMLDGNLGEIVDDYWRHIDEKPREIVTARAVNQPSKTLEELAHGYGQTRERVRQIEKRTVHDYIQWWDQLNLSLKLLLSAHSGPVKVDLHYTDTQVRLIMLIVDDPGHATLKPWVQTEDSQRQQLIACLQSVTTKRNWIKTQEIQQVVHSHQLSVQPAELVEAMADLDFAQVAETDVWTPSKGVNAATILLIYMRQHGTISVGTDLGSFQKVDKWSKRYFHHEIAVSLRAFSGLLNRIDQLIPVGDGLMRLYQAERYPVDLLNESKDLLDARFTSGYRFVRDNWLLDQVSAHLPSDVTSDEWYQAFKRRFATRFNYGTGRNNDIYPLDQKPITINQQIEFVARAHPGEYSLQQLRTDYGWESYTVQQAISSLPAIYIQTGRLYWLNIKAADTIIKPVMVAYFKSALSHARILTVQAAYIQFNDFMMDQEPDAFDQMRIYNVEALGSYLTSLDGIDVVGGFFILARHGEPDLPREIGQVWLEYLQHVMARPMTEKQLNSIVHAAGTSQSTWDQVHEARLRDANIVPVSQDLLLAGRAIAHTEALDGLVTQRVQESLEQCGFVATRTLKASDYTELPVVRNREFPEEFLTWTPELFISYAEQLGYRRLSWPKSMIMTNCDVLVAQKSPIASMQALVARQLDEWLRTQTNESSLFCNAVAAGLVPDRQDQRKWHFSNYFLQEQGFVIDELGNMGRQTK